MAVAVLIPVLERPDKVEPLVASIRASSDARPMFICSLSDLPEINAVVAVGEHPHIVQWEPGGGDYARKINWGYRRAISMGFEWMLLGADDLVFHDGWAGEALMVARRTKCCVIGTNDGGNPKVKRGQHATHSLVHADYLECGTVDADNEILCELYDHNFCNPPEAPVWMADCSFKPLGDVRVGELVVGWERIEAEAARVGTPRRALCYSEVLATERREAPLVRVVMESGREFRCTPDHRWLNAAWSPASKHAAQFVAPRVGRSLLHVVDPPAPLPPELHRTAGWLAGIYDGEGSGIYVATQSVDHNPEVVVAIRDALDALGVNYRWSIRKSRVAEFVLNGGRQSYLDFLLRVEPVRRESIAACVLGWRSANSPRKSREPIGARRFGHRDKIAAVEPAADRAEVVSLTTASGNYIAWGYASRNCDNEFVETARARRTFAFAGGAVVEHMHPVWKKGEWDAVYEKGTRDFERDRQLHRSRRPMWERL